MHLRTFVLLARILHRSPLCARLPCEPAIRGPWVLIQGLGVGNFNYRCFAGNFDRFVAVTVLESLIVDR